jgi:hypothetical protein
LVVAAKLNPNQCEFPAASAQVANDTEAATSGIVDARMPAALRAPLTALAAFACHTMCHACCEAHGYTLRDLRVAALLPSDALGDDCRARLGQAAAAVVTRLNELDVRRSTKAAGGATAVIRACQWLLRGSCGHTATASAAQWLELAARHPHGREALRAAGGVRVLVEALAASTATVEGASMAGVGSMAHTMGLLLLHDSEAAEWSIALDAAAALAATWVATVAPTEEVETAIWGLAMAGTRMRQVLLSARVVDHLGSALKHTAADELADDALASMRTAAGAVAAVAVEPSAAAALVELDAARLLGASVHVDDVPRWVSLAALAGLSRLADVTPNLSKLVFSAVAQPVAMLLQTVSGQLPAFHLDSTNPTRDGAMQA